MATAFVPNPNNDPIVLHKDNDKLNVDPGNLKWGTYKENSIQATRDGLNKLPDNRKEFTIVDDNGKCITPFCYYGLSTIADLMGYGNANVVEGLVRRHTPIKEGFYKGFYVERFEG